MHTVSILGCGWLGFELSIKLMQNHNRVKASTTSTSKLLLLEEKGIVPFLIDSQNSNTLTLNLDKIVHCDILVIAIPVKNEYEKYLALLHQIAHHPHISQIKQIIFISSSSVYPAIEKNMSEAESITSLNTSKKIIFEAEQVFLQKNLPLVILRCAGLMGYNRIAGKYFAHKILDCKKERVNYVHRDDVVDIIDLIISLNIKDKIYNLCAPQHPTKEEVYLSNAKKYGFVIPIFKNTKAYKERLIDGSNVTRELGYIYKYQNPIDFK